MKTHPLSVSYLVVGLAFLGIAGSWALHQADVISGADVEWLLPLTLVIAGALGLVVFAARGLRGRTTGADRLHDRDRSDAFDDTRTYDTEGDPR